MKVAGRRAHRCPCLSASAHNAPALPAHTCRCLAPKLPPGHHSFPARRLGVAWRHVLCRRGKCDALSGTPFACSRGGQRPPACLRHPDRVNRLPCSQRVLTPGRPVFTLEAFLPACRPPAAALRVLPRQHQRVRMPVHAHLVPRPALHVPRRRPGQRPRQDGGTGGRCQACTARRNAMQCRLGSQTLVWGTICSALRATHTSRGAGS